MLDQSVMYWVVLGVVNIPVILLVGWGVFGDWGGFVEALGYAIKPDLLSWMQGEMMDDWWAEMKLWVFVAGCGAVIYLEHILLQKLVFGGGEEAVETAMAVMRAVGVA